MIRTSVRRFFVAALGAGILFTAGVASAHPGWDHGNGPAAGRARHAGMRRMIERRVDEALAAAQVTPAQRSALLDIGNRLVETFALGRPHPGAEMGRALAMFESDTFDEKQVLEARAQHLTRARAAGDAVTGALREAHGALTSAQRKAIVGYVRARIAEHEGQHQARWHQMARAHVDEAIAAAKPTPAQRAVLDAARQRVDATIAEVRGESPHQDLDRALALFAADRWDDAQVAALRAEHEAKANRVADAITRSLHEAHDTLTPAQRKAVTDHIRAERARRMERHRAKMQQRFGGARGDVEK